MSVLQLTLMASPARSLYDPAVDRIMFCIAQDGTTDADTLSTAAGAGAMAIIARSAVTKRGKAADIFLRQILPTKKAIMVRGKFTG